MMTRVPSGPMPLVIGPDERDDKLWGGPNLDDPRTQD